MRNAGTLRFIGFLSFFSVIIYLFYGAFLTSKISGVPAVFFDGGCNLEGIWKNVQLERRQRVGEVCDLHQVKEASFEDLASDTKLTKFLLFNDEHQMIFCHTPKIASTNWKRIFAILNGLLNTTNPLDIERHNAHNRLLLHAMIMGNLTIAERKWRLQNYRKFMFVRHPLERLLSGYIDKMLDNESDSVNQFQKLYGAKILKLYRPEAPPEVVSRGGGVTFQEFVRYVTDPSVEDKLYRDPHWHPSNTLCKPCQMKYDFIGKYESLSIDTQMILRAFRVELRFSFPPREQPKAGFKCRTGDLLPGHMKQLTEQQIYDIYSIYERDFQLFGYDLTQWDS